jgi:hypothetical protein
MKGTRRTTLRFCTPLLHSGTAHDVQMIDMKASVKALSLVGEGRGEGHWSMLSSGWRGGVSVLSSG